MTHTPRKGAVHAFAARVFRAVAEWLIARRLATDRLLWRVRRFEEKGFGALLNLSEINYPYALIGANAFLMIVMLLFGSSSASRPGDLGAVSPLDLYRFGAAYTPSILAGQYWRLVTAMFLHGDFMHILFNCVAILIIAPRIEAVYGSRQFLALYVLAGIAGNVVSVFVRYSVGNPVLLIGSSGAVFGLLGAGAIYGLRLRGPEGDEIFKFMMVWIIIGVVYSFWQGADNLAHCGGAMAGGLFAEAVRSRAPRSFHGNWWRGIELACLVLIAICFVFMLHNLFTEKI